MNEYALIKDGQLVRIEYMRSQPEDIPHKGVVWLPVVNDFATIDPLYQKLSAANTVVEQAAVVRYKYAETLPRDLLISAIIEERERRLALGFDYDFGDVRGIHHIGTTAQDMKGWDEVTKAANSFVSLGLGTQEINVVTDTGPVVVTALEWLQIIVAATIARQPLWAASFVLQAMDPIPTNFTDNEWWD